LSLAIKIKKNIPYIMERLIDICKSPETGINIWFIINGIRPAYWLDSYKIQSKKKMDDILMNLINKNAISENLDNFDLNKIDIKDINELANYYRECYGEDPL
jgi:hypothetical protein